MFLAFMNFETELPFTNVMATKTPGIALRCPA
jgi:hypothetical protein